MTGTVLVKNMTSQSREVIFHDGREPIHYWLRSRQTVRVPDNFLTPTVLEVARRQIISIRKDS